MTLQYDPGAPLPYKVLLPEHVATWDLENWCIDNLGPRIRPNKGFIWRIETTWVFVGSRTRCLFRHEEDAVLFDMVWG